MVFYIPEGICFAADNKKKASTHTRIRKLTKKTTEKQKWERA
jgi:hypothetical protein